MNPTETDSAPPRDSHASPTSKGVRQQEELIAVVGIGWKLPGDTADTEKLWQLLLNGKSGHGPVPPSRYNAPAFYHPHHENPGTINSTSGYFLNDDPRKFENGFFGISNVEVINMDPQQRKLLETVFECFESAGATLEELNGTNVGCYVGTFSLDYPVMQLADTENLNRYTATGITPTLLANRIGHVFNLQGPSFTIDTGCSSSLYSLHCACTALDLRECDAAVVAGANLIQIPQQQILASKAGIISNSATCRTFDISADGYGRADGIGALYLKRLDNAIQHGDPIRAVIRGTAINSNGRTPGVMQPSADGQEKVMRRAYARAGLSVDDTDYVEAHGTGTAVGDPIEVDAISRVFSRSIQRPILIGSVKTNLGHSEPTSGITSVIKVILAMEHRIIPPTINLKKINPKISNSKFNVEIVREAISWPETPCPRASVNSFGFGGANSHAIIEAYLHPDFLDQAQTSADENSFNDTKSFLIPVSAHSEFSLKKRVEDLQQLRLCSVGSKLGPIAYTLASRRTRLQHRAYFLASLMASSDQLDIQNVSHATRPVQSSTLPITFIFTGQGAQWRKMGQKLFKAYGKFQQSIESQDAYLASCGRESSWSLTGLLSIDQPGNVVEVNVNQPDVSQVFCTAIQIALVDLLADWSIQPNTVVGHSSGEIAAAYAAGYLSCREAILLAYYRGIAVSLRNSKPGVTPGLMLAVGIDQHRASAYIQELGLIGQIDLACVNSLKQVTVSGDREAILIFKDKMDHLSLFNRVVRTESIAYHSHHMRGRVGQLYEKMIAEHLGPNSGHDTSIEEDGHVSMLSSVMGRTLNREQARLPRYWRENLENSVLFDKALGELYSTQDSFVIEIGPHPALQMAINENRSSVFSTRSTQLNEMPYACTLIREKDDVRCVLDLAGTLFNHGYEPCFDAINQLEPSEKRVVTSLPKYPWDYQNVLPWKEPRSSIENRNRRYGRHELLGLQVTGGSGLTLVWRNIISTNNAPWLRDHQFRSTILFPAAGFISMAIEAVCQAEKILPSDQPNISLRQMKLFKTLPLLGDGTPVEVFTELRRLPISGSTDSKEWWQFNIGSIVEGQHVAHVAGRAACHKAAEFNKKALAQRRLCFDENTMESDPVGKWYRKFVESGLNAGPAFMVIREVYTDRMKQKPQAQSRMKMNRGGPNFAVGGHEYVVHPTVIDGMLQTGFIAAAAGYTDKMQCRVPIAIEVIDVITSNGVAFDDDDPTQNVWSARSSASRTGFAATVTNSELYNPEGEALLRIFGVRNTLYQGVSDAGSKEPRIPTLRVCWKPDVTFLESQPNDKRLGCLNLRREKLNHSLNAVEDYVELAECLGLVVHKRPNEKIALLNMGPEAIEECLRVLKPDQHLKPFSEIRWGRLSGDAILDLGILPSCSSNTDENKALDLSNYNVIVADCLESPNLLEILCASASPEADLIISFRKDLVPTVRAWERPTLLCDMEESSASINAVSILMRKEQHAVVSGEVYIVGVEPESALNRAIHQRFRQEPDIKIQVLPLSKIDNSSVPPGSSVILTIEGEGSPILNVVNADDLRRIQSLTSSASRLLWITRGNLLRGESPEHVLARGAARAIRMEEPQLTLVTFDFDASSNISSTASHIFAAYEKTFVSGIVHVSRWIPDERLNCIFGEKLDMEHSEVRLQDCEPVELSIKAPGQLDTLSFERQPNPFRDLLDDEVEVEAKCYGMNAKDLYLLNDKFDIPSPSCSLEFSGVVHRVGPKVKHLRIGDRVVAVASGRYRNFEIVPEWTCVKLLPTEDFQSTCTLLLAFTTALYSIKYLARLRSGESILIHSASGGVGQAAIQLAKQAGATIFATVGNQEKSDWLSRTFDIPTSHIFCSRDSSFLPAVLDATDQRGVDVVINSLSGDLFHASLKTIAPLSRFVEIGKKDIFDGGRLDMLSINRSGSFMVLDLLDLVDNGGQWGKSVWNSLIEETMQLYRDHKIHDIQPRVTFDVSEIIKAFRFFSQPSRIGKVVVSMENPSTMIKLLPRNYDTSFDPKKTYLMIGGFGGIGSSVTRWMLSQGARIFVFLSRSGTSKPSAANLAADIRSSGGEVYVVTGDVSNRSDVQNAFDNAPGKIGGIVHASMSIRATHWHSLTCEDWHHDIAAKVQGTQNLHEILTARGGESELDFFLLLSSLSGTVGSPTEPSYCAANAYLDSFARFRRAQGLKAISLGLGAIADVGYLQEHQKIGAIYTRRGMQSISEDELLRLVDLAIAHGDDDAMPAYDTLMQSHLLTGLEMQDAKQRAMDSSSMAFDIIFQDPRAGLLKSAWDRDVGSAGNASSISRVELPQEILAAVTNGEKVEDAVSKVLLTKFSNIVMIPSNQLKADQPLATFGLDSMLAAEFRTFIFRSFEVDIPFESLLSRQITIGSIAAIVIEQARERTHPQKKN
ncbi:putative polyketide synthase [Annulohypoxylon stygium]|nr:putative polyketide synthase [Annulohypoxylon stygium]